MALNLSVDQYGIGSGAGGRSCVLGIGIGIGGGCDEVRRTSSARPRMIATVDTGAHTGAFLLTAQRMAWR